MSKLWIPNRVDSTKERKKSDSYTLILISAYGCKLQVVQYLKNALSLPILNDAVIFVRELPSIIIERTDLERANQLKDGLTALGAECVVEEYSPNRTKKELKEKYTDNLLHCPHCGSTNVTIGTRGYSLLTGFWGSNKTTNRCGACGFTWKPEDIR